MRRHGSVAVGWLTVAVASIAIFTFSSTALAQSGNNGTVKIHAGSTDTEPIVRNEPHVGTFHLHFMFADPTQTGWWDVRAWAPGDKGQVVLAGTYGTAGDGVDRQPASGEYTLPDGHYKLFWEGRADGNVKHKTFWVEGVTVPIASAAPSGEELPETGSPPVGAQTPPPTDLAMSISPDGDDGSAVLLAILTIALPAVIAAAAARRARRVRATPARAAAGPSQMRGRWRALFSW